MHGEKHVQDDLLRHGYLVKNDFRHLNMPGVTATHALVVGCLGVSARVPNLNVFDTAKLHESGI
jgi:hypothetical protein